MNTQINLLVEGKEVSVSYNEHFANVARMNESLQKGTLSHFEKIGCTYVDVPEIVGITGACENVDTLFSVRNRLDLPLFFSQTGQLSLEQSLQSFHGVCTIIHSGRDEEEEDARHLRQFRLTEEEFDCTLLSMTREKYDENRMFDGLLSHIQGTVQSMIRHIVEREGTILQKKYKRSLLKLKEAVKRNFLRITYTEAVKLLKKNGFEDLSFGDDLKSDHEAMVVKLLNKGKEIPIFITHYPKEIKFFNMKVSTKDPTVVLSADLIFPYSGEGTGSAVREHEFEKLNNRLITSNMFRLHLLRGGRYEDFSWYLNILKAKGTLPHAGYGIGNDRVLQYVMGVDDIRSVSLFSLLNRQTGDWDKKHYGEAGMTGLTQKHILLTIGKIEDKRALLSHIKRISQQPGIILYATEKTHAFLKEEGVLTSMVFKVSQIGRNPNIADLLGKRVFDLIINIPKQEKVRGTNEFTDGKLMRKGAVDMGISLITNVEVAITVLDNLATTSV